jgi:hypothetical protein
VREAKKLRGDVGKWAARASFAVCTSKWRYRMADLTFTAFDWVPELTTWRILSADDRRG